MSFRKVEIFLVLNILIPRYIREFSFAVVGLIISTSIYINLYFQRLHLFQLKTEPLLQRRVL